MKPQTPTQLADALGLRDTLYLSSRNPNYKPVTAKDCRKELPPRKASLKANMPKDEGCDA